MNQLKTELSLVLGEPLSRIERISEQPYAHLFSLYDAQGHAVPLLAKGFLTAGIARQEAYKLSILTHEGDVRMPTVYGLMPTQMPPYKEVLLIERLRGVPAEVPTRNPQRWETLKEQIVEGILAWHRVDSHRCVGTVDSTQENSWRNWYQQRVEVLWSTLSHVQAPVLEREDRELLYRSRASLPQLFHGFDDNAVLVHGNLTLRSMMKDPRSDQLLAMVNPGIMLWAPREYDLFRLCEEGMSGELLFAYLQRAPVSDAFVARRWLYVLWEAVARLLHTGQLDRAPFSHAARALLPWLT